VEGRSLGAGSGCVAGNGARHGSESRSAEEGVFPLSRTKDQMYAQGRENPSPRKPDLAFPLVRASRLLL